MPRRKRKRTMEEQWAHERATWKKQERAWRKQDEAWAREDRRIQRQLAPMKFDSDADDEQPDEDLDEEELLRRYPEGVTIIKNGVEITIRPHGESSEDEFQPLEKGWLLNIFFPGIKHPIAKWGDRISALIALAVTLTPLILLMTQNGMPFDKAVSNYGITVIDFITRNMGEVGSMFSILAIALTVPLMLPGPLAIIAAFILVYVAVRYPMWILLLLLDILRRGMLMIVRRVFRRRGGEQPETVDLSDPIQRQLAERRKKLRVKA